MAFTMDPETERLVSLLKISLRILGVTNREVARRMGLSPSYVSKLFSGSSEMRLDHVIRICRAAGLEPAEFFNLAYPLVHSSQGTASAAKLRELLQAIQPVPPPPKPVETLDEAKMEEMFKAMLERIVGRAGV
jgi:transcriptional regulator with XRE-family HTH domain